MIRSFKFHASVASLCFLWATMQHACAVLPDEPSDTKSEVLPMSSAFAPGVTTRRMSRQRHVEWNGEQYAPKDAVPVLMAVILDATADTEVRVDALGKMRALSNQIAGTAWVDGLVSRYYPDLDRDEKIGLLQCLIRSEDPRAFPVFIATLEQETDRTIRLFAAGGLARWNVRRGVAELLDQVHPNEAISREPTVTNEALKALGEFNRQKAWGVPDQETWKRIETHAGLIRGEKVTLYIAEIKKWFAENEHRFPDWKPGGPFPEVSAGDNNQPTD